MTAGNFCHEVGGRWCDNNQIGFARKTNVPDVKFTREIEQVGEDALADKRARRQGSDELLGGLCQNATHGEAALLEPADQVERLVGGDAAADDKQHALRVSGNSVGTCGRSLPRRGRLNQVERFMAGLFGRSPQDGAHLILDRASATRGAQAQQLFEPLIELADGERSHEILFY